MSMAEIDDDLMEFERHDDDEIPSLGRGDAERRR